ncbi:11531_t:CDS:2 [Ambispora gerdemannii]|uniref:11531_t:CDS:1 n=1 Tax=Ambispora gerdemannii TaxID=144530 RepID=A0A9N8ZHD7_9GLOM|nr:11531_t:CDS:2 [Ambispora gerdemannii]
MQSPDLEISLPPTHKPESQQFDNNSHKKEQTTLASGHEDNANDDSLLRKEEMFDFSEWRNPNIWRNASAEFWAVCVLTFMVGATAIASGSAFETGLAHIPIVGLLIIAVGPISGGHLNPLVTMTAVFTRVISFPRGLLYIANQTVGAAVGGALLRSLSADTTSLGACGFNDTEFSVGRAFIGESLVAFAIAFVVYAIALDPIRSKIFSLNATAFLVSATFAMVVWLSGGINAGWPGAGTNPAKCFGLSVGSENFSHHWVFWLGPLLGALIYAFSNALMTSPKKQRKGVASHNV